MDFFIRSLQRIFIFTVSVGILWLIVTLFVRIDQRIPFFLALIVTYGISAYILLPQSIFMSLMILRRGQIPCTTRAPDGLPADRVNIIVTGTKEELEHAFSTIGWKIADKLTFRSGLRMIQCFILNKPYPQAPFSPLYLFGRKQDVGFEECIGGSPRRRNHIRFWAANIDPKKSIHDIAYWFKKHPIDPLASTIWIGAGVKDIGFGLTSMSYQISHRTDRYIDKQRSYIINSLRRKGCIQKEYFLHSGEIIEGKRNITDGKIFCAQLKTLK